MLAPANLKTTHDILLTITAGSAVAVVHELVLSLLLLQLLILYSRCGGGGNCYGWLLRRLCCRCELWKEGLAAAVVIVPAVAVSIPSDAVGEALVCEGCCLLASRACHSLIYVFLAEYSGHHVLLLQIPWPFSVVSTLPFIKYRRYFSSILFKITRYF
jgi:hypothetical protein